MAWVVDGDADVRERKGPAFVHAKVVRPYSHSLSDDETAYKTPAEREEEAQRDPITRMQQLLLKLKFMQRVSRGEVANPEE